MNRSFERERTPVEISAPKMDKKSRRVVFRRKKFTLKRCNPFHCVVMQAKKRHPSNDCCPMKEKGTGRVVCHPGRSRDDTRTADSRCLVNTPGQRDRSVDTHRNATVMKPFRRDLFRGWSTDDKQTARNWMRGRAGRTAKRTTRGKSRSVEPQPDASCGRTRGVELNDHPGRTQNGASAWMRGAGIRGRQARRPSRCLDAVHWREWPR